MGLIERSVTDGISTLRGVGPKTASLLERAGIQTISDLLFHYPRAYIDRTQLETLANAPNKTAAVCRVQVVSHEYMGWARKRTLILRVKDQSTTASLLCYGRRFLARSMPLGQLAYVSGHFIRKKGEIQTSNFELEPLSDSETRPVLPVYPLSSGLSQPLLRRLTGQALESVRNTLMDPLPAALLKGKHQLSLYQALESIHYPSNLSGIASIRKYLAYREFFIMQLQVLAGGRPEHDHSRVRRTIDFALKDLFVSRLSFRLTDDQLLSLDEIEKDLFSARPMRRLLQGDVGCGKTLVALLAAADVIEAEDQVALMAPTELLARQLAEVAARWLEPLGIRVALLMGEVKSSDRKLLLESLKSGEIQLLVGTHTLFSDDVDYKRLGMVIIDEQQRFGVGQRQKLISKASDPDLLLMTATPIPRTLALTAYGDLDLSTIRTMPEGRRRIVTHLTREGNEHKVYERVKQQVDDGGQAYFVYPVIEESPETGLTVKAAEEMYRYLDKDVFPDIPIGLIHSRIEEEKKSNRMELFASGDIKILVATTVVEVGVDVPAATCMVVEHAERFGLSALHQLRGRVGRGNRQSYAFLIYGRRLTEQGVRRLRTMMATSDGFRIAEEDLKIRGPGEMLGVRQSGFLNLKIADLVNDADLLVEARHDVIRLLKEDPNLNNYPSLRELAASS